jgi:hypothetical protein
MTMIEKMWPRTAPVPLIVFLFFVLLLLLWNASGVFAATTGIPRETRGAEFSKRNDISKIMSVLESRRPDKRALEKAAGKMSDMNERNLRLMSSLCDRISSAAGTPAADLAYSLLTALIVLS